MIKVLLYYHRWRVKMKASRWCHLHCVRLNNHQVNILSRISTPLFPKFKNLVGSQWFLRHAFEESSHSFSFSIPGFWSVWSGFTHPRYGNFVLWVNFINQSLMPLHFTLRYKLFPYSYTFFRFHTILSLY